MTAKRLLVLLLLSLAVWGCKDRNPDSTAEIQLRFDERIARLTERITGDCQKDVLELANARADSLLIQRARRMRRIEGRPPRPNRPGAPPVRELSAPLPLRPLFPFEIRFDTLLRDSLYLDSLRLDSTDRMLLRPEIG
ncbi:hypothetical protein [Neolewinella antarctica]|uniref:Lipoprotein n=1 Tax=Neolewinella antarctica TaxID=442734 RepID=A0ABX0XEL1_9BACT|nr:hypothetical protein [Neolewinella antarctica]NJC27761.1 hypothetical protein [Neolewinella antarctica]